MNRREACQAVRAAMRERGVTFAKLAADLDLPPVWVAAAVLGQHPFSPADADRLVGLLGVSGDVAAAVQEVPSRGGLDAAVPVDPTVYRLYEVIQVYGPALKALINEEFGDGIMSAINFKIDLERVPDPAGDRVRITLDGKFLPYQWG
jgi:cyanate lyase